jgi:hypothetical protein
METKYHGQEAYKITITQKHASGDATGARRAFARNRARTWEEMGCLTPSKFSLSTIESYIFASLLVSMLTPVELNDTECSKLSQSIPECMPKAALHSSSISILKT